MIWLKHLYVGDGAYKERRKILWNIRHRRWDQRVFLLVLSVNPANQLEIISTWELKQPYYRGREDLTVVGIAKGYQDAVMLVMRIADECYRKNGDGDIRSFLTDKIQKEGAK